MRTVLFIAGVYGIIDNNLDMILKCVVLVLICAILT